MEGSDSDVVANRRVDLGNNLDESEHPKPMSDNLDRRKLIDGPTREFNSGDIIEVTYQGDVVATVQITGRIRDHSLEISEGLSKGKITFVGYNDIRLYLEARANSQTVLRNVSLKVLDISSGSGILKE